MRPKSILQGNIRYPFSVLACLLNLFCDGITAKARCRSILNWAVEGTGLKFSGCQNIIEFGFLNHFQSLLLNWVLQLR